MTRSQSVEKACQIIWLTLALAVVVGAIAWGLQAGEVADALNLGCAATGVAVLACALTVGLIPPLLRLLSPAHQAAATYSQAIAQYEADRRAFEYEQQRLREAHWRGLSGFALEFEVSVLFRKAGYAVKLTPASRDKGVDLFASKDGRQFIVQCKGHSREVGPAVVRETFGTMVAHGADEAIVVSPAGFTRGAREFAEGKPMQLLGAAELVALQAGAR